MDQALINFVPHSCWAGTRNYSKRANSRGTGLVANRLLQTISVIARNSLKPITTHMHIYIEMVNVNVVKFIHAYHALIFIRDSRAD